MMIQLWWRFFFGRIFLFGKISGGGFIQDVNESIFPGSGIIQGLLGSLTSIASVSSDLLFRSSTDNPFLLMAS